MTDPYLWHVTLDTGHGRRSLRSEVDEAVVTVVGQHLAEALAGEMSPLPGPPGYTLHAKAVGPALLGTVYADEWPVVTIGVVGKARGVGRLWQMLHEGRTLATDAGDPPRPPWCAVRFEPALADHADATAWLGDYERLLAWAFLDGPT